MTIPDKLLNGFLAEPVEAQSELTDIFGGESTGAIGNALPRLQPIITAISTAKATLLSAAGASVARFRATLFWRDK
jgi:hypothetical protein